MRIPSNDDNKKVLELNNMHNAIAKRYLETIDRLGCYKEIDVMLPDLTIAKHLTFDIERFRAFFDDLTKNLDWKNDGVSITTTDDLKRMHIQFDTRIKKHQFSCYLAVQYHTLLFYECDAVIVKLREALDKVSVKLNDIEERIKKEENEIVEEEIKRLGYDKRDDYELLLLLYNNQEIAKRLEEKSNEIKSRYPYEQLMNEKKELLRGLNSHIIEVYTLDKRLIDYMQLMQGEEGLCIYFDLSIKNIDRVDINPIIEKMNEINKAVEST